MTWYGSLMRDDFAIHAVFACSTCRTSLHFDSDLASCGRCGVSIPVVDGFVIWTERFISANEARRRGNEIRAGRDRYRSLLERKHDRRIYEPYAWFRPFNESTRALEMFRNLLTDTVEAGVPILDTWCRTGWTGEMLASWFPENPVISLWEGDRDHLGYQGFMHWLPAARRAPNLTVVFANANEPLPFADDSFGLVHGLDTLHRYDTSPLMGECLRITSATAPIIFPHIHLTNSEPDPFFERGCTQLHGSVWGEYLDHICQGTGRSAWVLAEQDLYPAAESRPLIDSRNTPHYNGFVVIGPSSWGGVRLNKPDPTTEPDAFLFANPLVTVEAATGRAWVDPAALSGTVEHMVNRHPVALAALEPATSRRLTSTECQILSHAETPARLSDIAARLDISNDALVAASRQLVADNVLQIEKVSQAMAELQGHYRSLKPQRRNTFGALWESLPIRYASTEVLHGSDGSLFGFDDVDTLVQAVRHWFTDHGLAKGDRVAFLATGHLEYCISVWAAWLSGLVAVPLSADLSDEHVVEAFDQLAVKAVACDRANTRRVHNLRGDRPYIVFDPTDVPENSDRYFIDEVGPLIEQAPLPEPDITGSDDAAIIYTSGSSGAPKAVRLSVGSLLHTGAVMGDVLGLRNGDRLLSLAPVHTMSGLRNPFVTALSRGATTVIAPESAASALSIVDACYTYGINVLTTGPVFLDRIASLVERLKRQLLPELRTIATTADRLDPESSIAVQEILDVQIVDYYGLTETGGVVLAAVKGCEGDLGIPAGAVVEVHQNDTRVDPGTVGEIRVSGPSVMSGYLGDAAGVRFEAGWVYTGDHGVSHEDGSISLLGRMSDQLKRSNGEIYPHERVLAALESREDIEYATVFVEPQSRQLVLQLTGSTVDRAEIRMWLEQQCGTEGMPDRLSINDKKS